MKKLYILRDCYESNTASINRSLAFAKGYGELGVNTNIVFIFPNYKREKIKESFLNVTFTYLWDRYCPQNKYLKHLICRVFLLCFILRLKKNDTVILYGTINPWFLFCFNRKIKIYNEIAEHPYVHTQKRGIKGKIQYQIFKKFCRRIDGILPITPSLNEFFIKEFGLEEKKVCTINMIVDYSRFENIDIKEKKSTITYCGTISENKDGIGILLNAFKKVTERHKDVTLTLMGGFENETTKKNVHNSIKTLDIEDKVLLTGIIQADQMPMLLSEAKILVLSRPQNRQAKYGFPTKLGEYLMTANPIVITDVGDFKLYLKDKQDVIYALPDNSDDFAEKLMWALTNYEEAQQIGNNGKEVALKSFNYKIEAKKALQFIGIN